MAREVDDFESDLDQYIEDEEPGWLSEFVTEQVRRAPWWTISLLVHVIALLIMYKWPYRVVAMESAVTPIEVDLYENDDEEITEEPPPPEENPVEEDLDVPIEDIPISPIPPTKEDPGPPLDMPLVDEMVKDVERPVPSIDPPSNTPVFAVDGPVRGLKRGIYSGRSRSGQGRMVGGDGGTSKGAQSSVMAGLIWLAKAQEKDGRWSCKNWGGGGDHDVGMTGLSLLAFLGAGYTHTKGKFKTTVANGLSWLHANQKGNGSFGWKTFYEQGIATMAVSEAYGLTRAPSIGRMAQAAINYVVAEQPEHGGYRYRGGTTKSDGDMSVTGWQIMAIKSAICSELKVPESAVERSRLFLKNSKREYGTSAYTVGGGRGGKAVSAIGMLCKQFLGGDYGQEIGDCADFLLRDIKVGKNAKDVLVGDLYYTYYSVLAMFQMGGEYWVRWNKAFRDPLVKCQIHTPHFDKAGKFIRGSWDPANHQWANRGGRVYSTAMAILSLEVYYRFLPVYKR